MPGRKSMRRACSMVAGTTSIAHRFAPAAGSAFRCARGRTVQKGSMRSINPPERLRESGRAPSPAADTSAARTGGRRGSTRWELDRQSPLKGCIAEPSVSVRRCLISAGQVCRSIRPMAHLHAARFLHPDGDLRNLLHLALHGTDCDGSSRLSSTSSAFTGDRPTRTCVGSVELDDAARHHLVWHHRAVAQDRRRSGPRDGRGRRPVSPVHRCTEGRSRGTRHRRWSRTGAAPCARHSASSRRPIARHDQIDRVEIAARAVRLGDAADRLDHASVVCRCQA